MVLSFAIYRNRNRSSQDA